MKDQAAYRRRFSGLSPAEWRLWALWVLVTTVLGFLGVVGLVFGSIGGLLAVLFGVLVGAAQSRLLRQRVDRPDKWVWATAFGWIACVVVNSVAYRIVAGFQAFQAGHGPGFVVVNIVFGALLGAVIGTAQWRFLRDRVYRASRWVWATAMSWGVGWGLGWSLFALIARRMQLSGDFVMFPTIMAVAVGITVSAITGYVLNLLLRHPITSSPEPGQESNTE